MKQVDRSNGSVLKTFINYAIPSAVAMLVTSIYAVIEGVILGRGLGAHALAAVNIAFPATLIINAFVLAIAVGGANLMSIRLGEGKPEQANNIFMQSIVVVIALITVFVLVGNLFLRQICIALGADQALLPDVMTYLKYFLFTCIFYGLSTTLNTFIRNDGDPKLSMFSALTSTVATAAIVYAAVFIFKFGIAGAAFGGGLGYLFSIAVASVHLLKKEGILRVAKPKFRKIDIQRIFALGFPSMMTELAMACSTFCFNFFLIMRIGELGVSAYSIVNYINAIVILIMMGLSQGLQPIASYNYGAGRMKIVSQTYRIAVFSALILSGAAICIMTLFGSNIIRIFDSNDRQLVELTKTALFLVSMAYIPIGINMVNITFYQSVERAKFSTFISVMRGFVFIQVGLLVLPMIFGNNGIWLSTLFGESITLILTFICSKRIKRLKIKKDTRST